MKNILSIILAVLMIAGAVLTTGCAEKTARKILTNKATSYIIK